MMESRILRLAICMMALMLMAGVFAHSAYAESHGEKLEQRMKADFAGKAQSMATRNG